MPRWIFPAGTIEHRLHLSCWEPWEITIPIAVVSTKDLRKKPLSNISLVSKYGFSWFVVMLVYIYIIYTHILVYHFLFSIVSWTPFTPSRPDRGKTWAPFFLSAFGDTVEIAGWLGGWGTFEHGNEHSNLIFTYAHSRWYGLIWIDIWYDLIVWHVII